MAVGSASKIALWRRCKKKAWYRDILKIVRRIQNLAPSKGTLIHKSLQYHYNGQDWTQPIKSFVLDLENVFDEERAEWIDLPQEAYRIIRGYLLAYKDVDAKIRTLETEYQFEIPLGKHTYTGTIDWVFEDDQGVWVADHKTVKTLPELSDLYMDIQTLMYVEAVNILKLAEKPLGVVFNHIRTKAPRVPALLKSGGVSKAACDTDVRTYFEAVKSAGLNPEDYRDMLDKLKSNIFFKRTKIPTPTKTIDIIKKEIGATLDEVALYTHIAKDKGEKAEHLFPRNMMKQRCAWDCEYYPICFGELAGMNTQGIIEDKYTAKEERYDDEQE